MKKTKYKIAFLTGSPNWHHPELYERISLHDSVELKVYFCSQEALNGTLLSQAFGVKDKNWGLDLLKGYKYKFLKNYSPLNQEFGKRKIFRLLNFGIWNEIVKSSFDAVVITMWNDITYWMAAFACKVSNTPFFFAGDSTILTEEGKPIWLQKVKQFILGRVLFPMAAGFLYRNELGRQLYLHYKVPEERLFFYPLSVDYKSYSGLYYAKKKQKTRLRLKNGFAEDAFVILYVGRLSREKRPLDLIEALKKVKIKQKTLVIVGDGELTATIERKIKDDRIQGIYLVGFKPRNEVLDYYAFSDLFILPSEHEPEGDVVKEAMCFGLPIIASNKVGASHGLVKHNENGYIYQCGNTDELANYINESFDKKKRERFGQRSLEIVKNWDHETAVTCLVNTLEHLYEE